MCHYRYLRTPYLRVNILSKESAFLLHNGHIYMTYALTKHYLNILQLMMPHKVVNSGVILSNYAIMAIGYNIYDDIDDQKMDVSPTNIFFWGMFRRAIYIFKNLSYSPTINFFHSHKTSKNNNTKFTKSAIEVFEYAK